MANKRPSFQFYPGDWLKDPDLRKCEPATRGIWIDLICAMHNNDESGEISGTVMQLSRVLGVMPDELIKAVTELAETGTATVIRERDKSGTCPQLSHDCPDVLTVINRRMYEEEKRRKNERLRKRRQRSPDDVPGPVPKLSHLPSSSSSSTSVRDPSDLVGQSPPDFDQKADQNSTPKNGTNSKATETKLLKQEATTVIAFLNEKTGSNFPVNETNLALVMGRLKEGFTATQCRQVVAKKHRDWASKDEMSAYLRPKTLFGKTNFSNYVGELGRRDPPSHPSDRMMGDPLA